MSNVKTRPLYFSVGIILLLQYLSDNSKKLKAKKKEISYLESEIRALNNIICDSYYDTKYLIKGVKEFKDKKLTEDKLNERVWRVKKIQERMIDKFGFNETIDT